MLADGDTVKYSYGWVFVHMDEETADDKLTAERDQVEEDVTKLEGELGDVRTKMDELKATLYSKFGNTINLEEGVTRRGERTPRESTGAVLLPHA